jgi:hypothetical protein
MSNNQLTTSQIIVASVLVMLVCAGLGAFGGCDIGLEQTARGVKGGFNPILLGMIVGLLIGLVVSLWDKPWAKQPSPPWRRFALRFAYAVVWLLVAVIPLRAGRNTADIITPARVPLRFDKVNTVSATFTADESATYVVEIELKRNLPFEDIEAFMRDEQPHRGPHRPEIVWTVNDVREADREIHWQAEAYGETVTLSIGQFEAAAGHRYTVTTQVIKPSPDAQVLSPVVKIAMADYLTYYSSAMTAQMGRMVAGIIGTVLLIRSLVKLRDERRESIAERSDG